MAKSGKIDRDLKQKWNETITDVDESQSNITVFAETLLTEGGQLAETPEEIARRALEKSPLNPDYASENSAVFISCTQYDRDSRFPPLMNRQKIRSDIRETLETFYGNDDGLLFDEEVTGERIWTKIRKHAEKSINGSLLVILQGHGTSPTDPKSPNRFVTSRDENIPFAILQSLFREELSYLRNLAVVLDFCNGHRFVEPSPNDSTNNFRLWDHSEKMGPESRVAISTASYYAPNVWDNDPFFKALITTSFRENYQKGFKRIFDSAQSCRDNWRLEQHELVRYEAEPAIACAYSTLFPIVRRDLDDSE